MDSIQETSSSSMSTKAQQQTKKKQLDLHQTKNTPSAPLHTINRATEKGRVQSIESDGTSSGELNTQGNETNERSASTTPKPSTILEICTKRTGSVFEGDILVVYGPASNRYTNIPSKTEIVHVDLVDANGQMTITVNISNTLINTFYPRMVTGSSIRITNFLIKRKTQYERGDADCCLALTTKSLVETVPTVCNHHRLTPDSTISQLIEAESSYAVGSFGAIVISYHVNKNQYEVHIKDGDLQQDMATVVGTLKAKNVHLPPYEACCNTCQRTMFFDTPVEKGSAHCTNCRTVTQYSYHHNLICTLHKQNSNIDYHLHGDLLQQSFPDLAKIAYEQYSDDISTTVFLLCRFQIYGTFTLAINNSIVKIVKQ